MSSEALQAGAQVLSETTQEGNSEMNAIMLSLESLMQLTMAAAPRSSIHRIPPKLYEQLDSDTQHDMRRVGKPRKRRKSDGRRRRG